MRILFSGVLCFAAGWSATSRALAQGPDEYLLHTRSRAITFPVRIDPERRKTLKEIQLHVSSDLGKTWKGVEVISADGNAFQFRSEKDGLFWVTMKLVDKAGNHTPVVLDGSTVSQKLVIDTVPPKIQLKPLPVRSGNVGVAWNVADANLDPDATKLEYRYDKAADWIDLLMEFSSRAVYWAPKDGLAVEVRISARDLAGNASSISIRLPALAEKKKN